MILERFEFKIRQNLQNLFFATRCQFFRLNKVLELKRVLFQLENILQWRKYLTIKILTLILFAHLNYHVF